MKQKSGASRFVTSTARYINRRRTIYLNPDGTVSTTSTGTPFSAEFVGDSNTAASFQLPIRHAVSLAFEFSDQKRLMFYVRGRSISQICPTLLLDHYAVGRLLPPRFVRELVQSGVREEARAAGVVIDLISDPM